MCLRIAIRGLSPGWSGRYGPNRSVCRARAPSVKPCAQPRLHAAPWRDLAASRDFSMAAAIVASSCLLGSRSVKPAAS